MSEVWEGLAFAASWAFILAGAAGALFVLWGCPEKGWGLWHALMAAGGCLLLLRWLQLVWLLLRAQAMPLVLTIVATPLLSLLVCALGICYLWQCLRGKRERSLLRMLPAGLLTCLGLKDAVEVALTIVAYVLDAR